jgi:hypothetical protein
VGERVEIRWVDGRMGSDGWMMVVDDGGGGGGGCLRGCGLLSIAIAMDLSVLIPSILLWLVLSRCHTFLKFVPRSPITVEYYDFII